MFPDPAFCDIRFAQITDPHLFDPGDEPANESVLQWSVDCINSNIQQGATYNFVVVTGDLGVEQVIRGATTNDFPQVTAPVQMEITKAVEILAGHLETSLVKRWLFLPGNNDLVKENPETIGCYRFFVQALSARLGGNGMVIKDLSARDGDPGSGRQDEPVSAASADLVRFIGFDNASFKANGLRTNALEFESYQTAEITRVKQLIPGNDLKNYLGAYIFYHIPEIEDPYYDSLAMDDTNLLRYEAGRGEFANQYPRSAWTVTQRVRDEWAQVVTNDRVLGLFAGHFHSANRSVYEGFGWMLNPSVYTPSLHKLLITPPIAIKKQQDKPVPAQGYREVIIGADGKIFKTQLFFHEPPARTGNSNVPGHMESVKWWTMPVYLVITPVSVIMFLGMFFGVGYWLLRWSGIAVSGPSHNALILVTADLAAAVLGFVALGVLTQCGGKDVCRVLGFGTLWALASLAVGGSLGILFGAPRSSGGKDKDGDGKEKAKTLLEEMADWLSKLIVGGSLFESRRILTFLDLAGRNFAATISAPESILWSGVGSALLVYFSIVGFFGSYFLMRLYISRALDEADGRSEVSDRTGLPQTKLDALEGAPLSVEQSDDLGPIAKEAATEISAIPLESLTNWRDVRLWAKAKLSRNEVDAALAAYQKAIEIVPNDAETRLGYATALSQKGSSKALILQHLERAHDTLMLKTTKDLRKNVFKSLVYQCLYLKAPESFIKALQYSKEYFAGPDPVESGGLWINIACAYGQAYAWLAGSDQNMLVKPSALCVNAAQPTLSEPVKEAMAAPNQVTGTAKDDNAGAIQLEREKQLSWLRQQALVAVKVALSRDPDWKEKLQELLSEGDKKSQDNDLASFRTDPDFCALAGLPIPAK